MSLDIKVPLERMQSMVKKLALFEQVNLSEPKSAPGKGLNFAFFLQRIAPVPSQSGQASTTGLVVFTGRIYSNMLQKPESALDIQMALAAAKVIEAFSGDIDLGDAIRYVDLLGMTGTALSGQGGYLQIDSGMFRIFDITIPLVVNDIWNQVI
ncbi:hypothetical protein UK23_29515 [Lentzea aerocolonigenes]|uniref:Uncharacterized protein n=1 Tax=Lentzea aerocolonigenes TaxID=68170 RepID=A0A0F0GMA3_LENAE|nr:hypothetical protein [Lentzea aerocolonigenes]KJK44440.1 hypothetical protein UK23_29515 [Lentzea aerocolonigenes]